MASSHPPPHPDLAWVEIGRAAAGGHARWATWIALLGGGDALYRTLVVADGSASVAVELRARHPPAARTLHRGGRRLPPPGTGDDGPVVGGLLDAADEAARAALAAPEGTSGPRRGGAAHAEAAPAGRPAPHRPASAVEDRRSGPSPQGP